jgi:hypothetical protein
LRKNHPRFAPVFFRKTLPVGTLHFYCPSNRERQEVPINNYSYEYQHLSFSKEMDKRHHRLYHRIIRIQLLIQPGNISGMARHIDSLVSGTIPISV